VRERRSRGPPLNAAALSVRAIDSNARRRSESTVISPLTIARNVASDSLWLPAVRARTLSATDLVGTFCPLFCPSAINNYAI
jgi:hypothetical protein